MEDNNEKESAPGPRGKLNEKIKLCNCRVGVYWAQVMQLTGNDCLRMCVGESVSGQGRSEEEGGRKLGIRAWRLCSSFLNFCKKRQLD